MFYSIDLLSAHRGKFGIIWLAATRVRKQLSRKELNSVNIVTACNEITSYILGETQIRLSLYLASQLTFGICIIYREKTVVMLLLYLVQSVKLAYQLMILKYLCGICTTKQMILGIFSCLICFGLVSMNLVWISWTHKLCIKREMKT